MHTRARARSSIISADEHRTAAAAAAAVAAGPTTATAETYGDETFVRRWPDAVCAPCTCRKRARRCRLLISSGGRSKTAAHSFRTHTHTHTQEHGNPCTRAHIRARARAHVPQSPGWIVRPREGCPSVAAGTLCGARARSG